MFKQLCNQFIVFTLISSSVYASDVWLIQQLSDGGAIGYKSDGDDVKQKIFKLISCPNNYTIVEDEIRVRHNYYNANAGRKTNCAAKNVANGIAHANTLAAQSPDLDTSGCEYNVSDIQDNPEYYRELLYRCNPKSKKRAKQY